MNWNEAMKIMRTFNVRTSCKGDDGVVVYAPPKQIEFKSLFDRAESGYVANNGLMGTAMHTGTFVRYYLEGGRRHAQLGYQPSGEASWYVEYPDLPDSPDEVYSWIDEKAFRKTVTDSEYIELKSLWVALCDQYKNT